MNPNSWLMLCRSVRFGETDAAGVMHFQQLLRWCHEAYEESLERFGLNAAEIFPTLGALQRWAYRSFTAAPISAALWSADPRWPSA